MAPTNQLSYDNVRPITAKAPWGRFSGLVWGSGIDDAGAVKVLLVHGRQHNCETFSALIPLLPPQGFSYVCLDLPGHGQSSPHPPGLPLDFMQYIYSIKLFVDAIRWDKFIFIGHSMGGSMGCIFCSVFADRVMGFVALDSFVSPSVPASKCVESTRRRLDDVLNLENHLKVNHIRTRYTLHEALEKIEQGRYGVVTRQVSRRMLERSTMYERLIDLYVFTDDPRLKLELVPYLSDEQVRCFLSALTCPSLLIIADHSLVTFKKDAKARQRHVGRFSDNMVIVSGDHFVHINNPTLVAPHVSQFLNRFILKSSL